MNQTNFSTSFTVKKDPATVFAAINNPRAWWSESIIGTTDEQSAIFDYHFQDLHRSKIQITELIPNQKVVWHVLDPPPLYWTQCLR
jgi:hypothetical protein